ncbi:MAG: hypothetical protein CMJ92_02675 [Planctomycetes bacterium]|nr:hypothetical protein [Planctomycetota bacterium]
MEPLNIPFLDQILQIQQYLLLQHLQIQIHYKDLNILLMLGILVHNILFLLLYHFRIQILLIHFLS